MVTLLVKFLHYGRYVIFETRESEYFTDDFVKVTFEEFECVRDVQKTMKNNWIINFKPKNQKSKF